MFYFFIFFLCSLTFPFALGVRCVHFTLFTRSYASHPLSHAVKNKFKIYDVVAGAALDVLSDEVWTSGSTVFNELLQDQIKGGKLFESFISEGFSLCEQQLTEAWKEAVVLLRLSDQPHLVATAMSAAPRQRTVKGKCVTSTNIWTIDLCSDILYFLCFFFNLSNTKINIKREKDQIFLYNKKKNSFTLKV